MSGLRNSIIPSTSYPAPVTRTTTSPHPSKKSKMSLTQTYVLAHSARGKLSKEAARPAHNLRRLVGHANMLDNLMLDLADAEQEQENWFNQSVKNANKAAQEAKHVSWVEIIPEQALNEEDSDSESDEEEYEIALQMPLRRVAKTPPPALAFDKEDEEMEHDDEYDEDLALTRTTSHPPELMHEDSDTDSEDESMPPSPPSTAISFNAFSEKQRQAIATTSFYQSTKPISEEDHSFFDDALQAPIPAC